MLRFASVARSSSQCASSVSFVYIQSSSTKLSITNSKIMTRRDTVMIRFRQLIRFRRILISTIILVIVMTVIFTQVSIENTHNDRHSTEPIEIVPTNRTKHLDKPQFICAEDIMTNNLKFNLSGDDLLVSLHIQKTGGTTFEKHLVMDLKLDLPCSCANYKRRCDCKRPHHGKVSTFPGSTWLVSRFSTGWICGLHPDWSQLQACLAGLKRLYLVTWLRHPVHRVISEFRHVQRGATWSNARSYCERFNTQSCHAANENWSGVDLDEFLDCPSNMALNRQTRMLADYSDIDCKYSSQSMIESNRLMLESAKRNLANMAFFGLCEHQRASQLVFERTLGLKFLREFGQSRDNKTANYVRLLPDRLTNKILSRNQLDLELYQYATQLFRQRCLTFSNSSLCRAITAY